MVSLGATVTKSPLRTSAACTGDAIARAASANRSATLTEANLRVPLGLMPNSPPVFLFPRRSTAPANPHIQNKPILSSGDGFRRVFRAHQADLFEEANKR